MSDIYPLIIVEDRYNGTFSGGKWTAWNMCYVPSKIFADDNECIEFFSTTDIKFGRGETPQEAIDDLEIILDCGISDPEESTESEENNKMEPTKENMKLREELEKINLKLTKEIEKLTFEKEMMKKGNEKIKKELTLEKAANEAQHKFFREYAGKGTEVQFNYAIDETGEVTYVIVDKEEYKALKNCDCKIRLHGMDFTRDELVNRILELEKLKTPTIENFADEEPSTRADILDQAKKCVCGNREQDYGTPESNFQLIADLWNGYLGGRTDNPVISVTPVDVAMLMALLKIARIRNSGGSGDSFVDLAGYAACGGEIWHWQNHKDQN